MTFRLFFTGDEKHYAVSNWESALKYLKHSDFAKFIVEGLETSPDTVYVCIAKGSENIYAHPKEGDTALASGGFIVWNPESALAVINRKNRWFKNEMISPKLALLHEMGHAYQYLSETDSYKDAKKKGESLERLEQNVVAVIEHTVANELKSSKIKAREGKRWSYNDIKKLSKSEMEEGMRQNHKSINIIGEMRKNRIGGLFKRV